MRKWLAAMLLACGIPAHAAIWTDMWWNPAESGWGINIVHQADAMFITFFVYAADGSAKWYTASAFRGPPPSSGYAQYSGEVYETKGPWLGATFNPDAVQARKVGTVVFAPQYPGKATLSYSVDGVAVTKAIERMTFRALPLSGRYAGVYRVAAASCHLPSATVGSTGAIGLELVATPNADAATGTLVASLAINGPAECILFGAYRQQGSVFTVANAAACNRGGLLINFTDLSRTDEGLEGDVFMSNSACTVVLTFGATQLP